MNFKSFSDLQKEEENTEKAALLEEHMGSSNVHTVDSTYKPSFKLILYRNGILSEKGTFFDFSLPENATMKSEVLAGRLPPNIAAETLSKISSSPNKQISIEVEKRETEDYHAVTVPSSFKLDVDSKDSFEEFLRASFECVKGKETVLSVKLPNENSIIVQTTLANNGIESRVVGNKIVFPLRIGKSNSLKEVYGLLKETLGSALQDCLYFSLKGGVPTKVLKPTDVLLESVVLYKETIEMVKINN